jgi:hypothetical protein
MAKSELWTLECVSEILNIVSSSTPLSRCKLLGRQGRCPGHCQCGQKRRETEVFMAPRVTRVSVGLIKLAPHSPTFPVSWSIFDTVLVCLCMFCWESHKHTKTQTYTDSDTHRHTNTNRHTDRESGEIRARPQSQASSPLVIRSFGRAGCSAQQPSSLLAPSDDCNSLFTSAPRIASEASLRPTQPSHSRPQGLHS